MTTVKQDLEIGEYVSDGLTEYLAGEVGDAISKYLRAADYGWLADAIGDILEPQDVFSEVQLERWAEANGFVKEN